MGNQCPAKHGWSWAGAAPWCPTDRQHARNLCTNKGGFPVDIFHNKGTHCKTCDFGEVVCCCETMIPGHGVPDYSYCSGACLHDKNQQVYIIEIPKRESMFILGLMVLLFGFLFYFIVKWFRKLSTSKPQISKEIIYESEEVNELMQE